MAAKNPRKRRKGSVGISNIEQGMPNDEVRDHCLSIEFRHSLFGILRFRFLRLFAFFAAINLQFDHPHPVTMRTNVAFGHQHVSFQDVPTAIMVMQYDPYRTSCCDRTQAHRSRDYNTRLAHGASVVSNGSVSAIRT